MSIFYIDTHFSWIVTIICLFVLLLLCFSFVFSFISFSSFLFSSFLCVRILLCLFVINSLYIFSVHITVKNNHFIYEQLYKSFRYSKLSKLNITSLQICSLCTISLKIDKTHIFHLLSTSNYFLLICLILKVLSSTKFDHHLRMNKYCIIFVFLIFFSSSDFVFLALYPLVQFYLTIYALIHVQVIFVIK